MERTKMIQTLFWIVNDLFTLLLSCKWKSVANEMCSAVRKPYAYV